MARDMRNWMWAEALALLDQAERVHRGTFRPGAARRTACWEPPVDVLETDGELWIQVALPGVTPEQLQVGIEGQALLVTGERTLPVPRCARSAWSSSARASAHIQFGMSRAIHLLLAATSL